MTVRPGAAAGGDLPAIGTRASPGGNVPSACIRMSERSAGLPTTAPIPPATCPATAFCQMGTFPPFSLPLFISWSLVFRLLKIPMRVVVYVA